MFTALIMLELGHLVKSWLHISAVPLCLPDLPPEFGHSPTSLPVATLSSSKLALTFPEFTPHSPSIGIWGDPRGNRLAPLRRLFTINRQPNGTRYGKTE
ncbi:hypothetical protein SBV1_2420002 [Verrucomicrobia bacterium]|nr:hypothetical protein SBV1_2420002 [Verrucomicrobiota bacterium]